MQVDIIPLLQTLSNMSISYSGMSNGSSFSFTASYAVVSSSTSGGVTTYKVDIAFEYGGSPYTSVALVQSNGNVVSDDELGYNATGSQATSSFVSSMTPFIEESSLSASAMALYPSPYFKASGSVYTQSFGSTGASFYDQNYTASTLPEMFNTCGYSGSLTAFSITIGKLQQSSFFLVMNEHIVGVWDGESANFTIQVTWADKAS